jgi:protein TonB
LKYPAEAARKGEQGTSVIRAGVAADGSVLKADLLESSGSPRLDQAAMEHFKQACFHLARVESEVPVSGSVKIQYRWKLAENRELAPNPSVERTSSDKPGDPAPVER